MRKITILALHLGYGGIERCISNLVNHYAMIMKLRLYLHINYLIHQYLK